MKHWSLFSLTFKEIEGQRLKFPWLRIKCRGMELPRTWLAFQFLNSGNVFQESGVGFHRIANENFL